jgi:integrase
MVANAVEELAELRAHQIAQENERVAWGRAYSDHGLVFARQDRRPLRPDQISKTFARLVVGSGLRKITLHDLRHVAVSVWAAAGISAGVASKMAGHSSTALIADR